MNPHLRKWLQISFFNLSLIAFLGVIMRYKIVYSLPWVDQRNLLHAHSHFAFAGWITQALMSLLVSYLFSKGDYAAFARYRLVLYANLVTAYGMLVTFPFMGYASLSIIFSTLSIFVSYWFAIKYWKDLNRLSAKSTSHHCFKAAVLFNAVSSLGAFSLAYMLATKNIHPNSYLASIYFFLHFQYNGWFFFACMGLLFYQLNISGIDENKLKKIFLLFATACLPAYFLSALWLPIARWLYVLVVAAVILQLVGWILVLQLVRKVLPMIKKNTEPFSGVLFFLCAIALTIKLLLQTGSVIPSLSQLAFGFRPIVIGYLHLVLLGVISLYIIAYSIGFKLIPLNGKTKKGVIIFTSGIIVNEILLMIQGIADMNYKPVPFVNQFLLVAALILFTGSLVVNAGQQFKQYDSTHKPGKNN
jgi:hypothetical protein